MKKEVMGESAAPPEKYPAPSKGMKGPPGERRSPGEKRLPEDRKGPPVEKCTTTASHGRGTDREPSCSVVLLRDPEVERRMSKQMRADRKRERQEEKLHIPKSIKHTNRICSDDEAEDVASLQRPPATTWVPKDVLISMNLNEPTAVKEEPVDESDEELFIAGACLNGRPRLVSSSEETINKGKSSNSTLYQPECGQNEREGSSTSRKNDDRPIFDPDDENKNHKHSKETRAAEAFFTETETVAPAKKSYRIPKIAPRERAKDDDLLMRAFFTETETVAPAKKSYRSPKIAPRERAKDDDLLMRVLMWDPLWLTEPLAVDSLPPILQSASDLLPQMYDKSVLSAYPNIEAYYDVFHPLMLYELWATITKVWTEEKEHLIWNINILKIVKGDGFVLLSCSVQTKNQPELIPRELDLAALEIVIPGPDATSTVVKGKLFALIENVRKEKCARRNESSLIHTFTLRLRSNQRYELGSGVLHRVSSLRTYIKQWKIQAMLPLSSLCQAILNPENPALDIQEFTVPNDKSLLNHDQSKAVHSICNSMSETPKHEPKIALLQGPPGTGQSHVIVNIITNTMYNYVPEGYQRFPRILVCAPSNFAVGEIAFRLLTERKKLPKEKRFRMVRIGVPEAINRNVYDVSLDKLVDDMIAESSYRSRYEIKQKIIDDSDVICTTLNSSTSVDMEKLFVSEKNERPFMFCIIDEASQCTEPESLTPLFFGINKLIMVGDPKQLPATVCCQVAKKRRFDQSLFNRLFSYLLDTPIEPPIFVLNTQYRMHRKICHWPSKFFYGGKLISADTVSETGYFHPYMVFNVLDSQEKSADGGLWNEAEAQFVANLVEVMLSSVEMRSKSIGIITFYQKQRALIYDEVKKRCPKSSRRVTVNTVDAFQGREQDIVIVSCVRAKGKSLGFVTSKPRLNVALTRAKESLFICGHLDSLKRNESWKDMIGDATERGLTRNVRSGEKYRSLKCLILAPKSVNGRALQ